MALYRKTNETPPTPAQAPARKKRGGVRAFFAKPKIRLCAILLAWVLCVGVLLTAIIQIRATNNMYAEADAEYSSLQAAYGPGASGVASGEKPADPAAINPDFAGWLEIPGTAINYPVVRGADNTKYLNTSFEGKTNPAGTVFMDCRNTAGFSSQHVILYGHNMKNGSMFADLPRYLDANYLSNHPLITVTFGDETTTYRIFAARQTDAWDPAYQLSFADNAAFAAFTKDLGAPAGTTRLLTLSTCTNAGDDERVLVHAALVE